VRKKFAKISYNNGQYQYQDINQKVRQNSSDSDDPEDARHCGTVAVLLNARYAT